MTKTEKRIRLILGELKTEIRNTVSPNKKRDFCVVTLTFDFNEFYKQVRSVSNFMKKLRNNLPENRPFYKRISKNEIYNYSIDKDNVEINIFIELNEIFNKSDLSSKIIKLVNPSKMNIYFNDEKIYNEIFNRDFVFSSWGLVGLEYRNKQVG
jgi:hypothetical protein